MDVADKRRKSLFARANSGQMPEVLFWSDNQSHTKSKWTLLMNSMLQNRLMASLIVVLSLGSLGRIEAALETNLIANGGAESGAGSSDGSVVAVPSWITTSNFTVVIYGAPGGFPAAASPGPPDRGLNFFAGGPTNAGSTASQTIDTTADAAQIDAGQITFDLSGYLGGFSDQGDNAVLSATFLSASNLLLGSASIGPVTPDDRRDITGMLLRSTSGAVPVGTRSVNVNLQMTRLDFMYNDGYADNLSLIFHVVPEPPSLSLVAALAGLGVLWRRKRNSG